MKKEPRVPFRKALSKHPQISPLISHTWTVDLFMSTSSLSTSKKSLPRDVQISKVLLKIELQKRDFSENLFSLFA